MLSVKKKSICTIYHRHFGNHQKKKVNTCTIYHRRFGNHHILPCFTWHHTNYNASVKERTPKWKKIYPNVRNAWDSIPPLFFQKLFTHLAVSMYLLKRRLNSWRSANRARSCSSATSDGWTCEVITLALRHIGPAVRFLQKSSHETSFHPAFFAIWSASAMLLKIIW